MELRVLAADEWELLRDVRLRALKDSPEAYLADYDEEVSWHEATWRHRFVDSQWIVAQKDDRTVGLARVLRVDGRPTDERHIESVWVDPGNRRSGVLRAIQRHLVATEPAIRDWLLWVVDDNVPAREVYERLGFRPTGECQPLTDGTLRTELRFRFRTE
ncbi:MAG TPA: GNAT family N-acetyltransferase [Kribbella sp.]|uniref:GNAT family N-acetyltransferase n=1 Tax=Kribbella sp. TaxID=1871183 RepID=UPI002D79D7D9|nr:GNAT family N-acetyltransferase [Kribbella sp.]HET6295653.1 GNAT family N-acetyltransferase [Kribbella sp.]